MPNTVPETIAPIPTWLAAVAGGLIGGVESVINHPLWVLKTRKQAGLPFTWNPMVLWRGLLGQGVGTVPMDMIQTAGAIYLNERVFNNRDKTNISAHAVSGYLGGAVSGVVISPVEMILAYQQKLNISSYSAVVSHLLKNGGYAELFRGTFGTAQRVGIYCLGFYTVIPQFKWYLQREKFDGISASAISGLVGGAVMSAISHVPDTIKTVQQMNDKRLGFVRTAMNIYAERGLIGYMDGFAARGARITLASWIMAYLTEEFERQYYARYATEKPAAILSKAGLFSFKKESKPEIVEELSSGRDCAGRCPPRI